MDKLKGKKIAHVYHDSAFGKEPIPVLEDLAKKYGFELLLVPVPPPGVDQQAQWLRVRQDKPDFALLWAAGVMVPTAIKTAAKVGYPRDKIIGIHCPDRKRRDPRRRTPPRLTFPPPSPPPAATFPSSRT